jgi:hypothetical protein
MELWEALTSGTVTLSPFWQRRSAYSADKGHQRVTIKVYQLAVSALVVMNMAPGHL